MAENTQLTKELQALLLVGFQWVKIYGLEFFDMKCLRFLILKVKLFLDLRPH